MNLLGKILTLLIMVMSILFLFVAFMVAASHQNWKAQAEENKKEADRQRANKLEVESRVAVLRKDVEKEKVIRTLQLAQLESQWQASHREFLAKEKELIAAQYDLATKTNSLKETEERLKEQDSQVTALTAQVNQNIENITTEHKKVIELQTQLFEDRGKLEELKAQKEMLAGTLAKFEKVMRIKEWDVNADTEHIPPVLNGIVTAVREDLVEISLGSDDGLRKGHTIDIFRGGQFRGTARVTDVRPNDAVARLIPEMTNAAIAVDDTVTTEWSRPVASNTSNK